MIFERLPLLIGAPVVALGAVALAYTARRTRVNAAAAWSRNKSLVTIPTLSARTVAAVCRMSRSSCDPEGA